MLRPAAMLALLACSAEAQGRLDDTPRIAVMSAFPPEIAMLREAVEDPAEHRAAGTTFVTGRLEGRDVVLFLSGISMVNAAMTTQMAADRFDLEAVVFSGIAGGVDPSLDIGDVVVAERWGQYLDAVFARETAEGFALPPWMSSDFAPHGMIFTRAVSLPDPDTGETEERFWFEADAALLERARRAARGLELSSCDAEGRCLGEAPEVVIGGNGVSGSVFVDNAAFREHVFEVFDARVLDMESAAVAHVAHLNGVPFVAFRSLSDLAGGGEGANEMQVFLGLAANNSAALLRAFLAAE